MGTHKLRRFDTFDFYQFLKRSGFTSEMDFWSSLSGLTKGTETDHMIHYLKSLGYQGCPSDQFYQFLADQAAWSPDSKATRYDLANKFFQGSYSEIPEYSSGYVVRDDSGNIIYDDEGDNVIRDDS